MVRRVGFGSEPRPPRPPRHPRRVRPRAGAARKSPLAEDAPRAPAARRVVGGVVLAVFLIGWTIAIALSAAVLLRAGPTPEAAVVGVWLLISLWVWLFAARRLLRILRGEPARSPARPGARPAGDPGPYRDDVGP